MNHSLRFFFLKKYRSTMKYRAGKLEPGGEERFRRRQNRDVSMEIGDSPTQETNLLEVDREINIHASRDENYQLVHTHMKKEKKKLWKESLKKTLLKKIRKVTGTLIAHMQTTDRIVLVGDGYGFRRGRVCAENCQKVHSFENCLIMFRGENVLPELFIRYILPNYESPYGGELDAQICCLALRGFLREVVIAEKKKSRAAVIFRNKPNIFSRVQYHYKLKFKRLHNFDMTLASYRNGIPQLYQFDGSTKRSEDISGIGYDCIGHGDWLAKDYIHHNRRDEMSSLQQIEVVKNAVIEASKCRYEPNGGIITMMQVESNGIASVLWDRSLDELKQNVGWNGDTNLSQENIEIMRTRRNERRGRKN